MYFGDCFSGSISGDAFRLHPKFMIPSEVSKEHHPRLMDLKMQKNGDSVPLLLDVVEGFLEFENQSQGRDSGRRSVINSWGWWKVWGFETANSRKQSFCTTFLEKLCWKNLGMSFEFVECGPISKAATYNLLQARVDVVLFEIIFPLMCFNENDQKLWEEDPHEYVRKHYGELEILLVIIMKIWDWDKEDELQMQNITPSSCASLATLKIETIVSNGETIMLEELSDVDEIIQEHMPFT
ncbi:hypothetical protein L2E82_17045 [Cichorium intybus]|uniref:Uncharacterized protein n=1 Tax=Cichorium intybus TaxID=13427 RepID=A0ACB9F6V3_CICIN|nr:hypothetical protein L2E82_17045 [Cichorium intybus]